MEMEAELEDKPNLFLELVAWRQLGFNAFENPSATTNGYIETFSNKHTPTPTIEQKASNARTTVTVQGSMNVMHLLWADR